VAALNDTADTAIAMVLLWALPVIAFVITMARL
jgi:hypothetical protein